VDVYAGCQKDYTGNDVTAANFLNVLTGNQAAVPAGHKVLKSTASDNVFVFFTDHGGTGIVAFPVGPYLTVSDLNKSLRQMFAANMYRKLVFYMEACESGSMFENVLPTNLNIYVTTASNAVESSWGCYCPPEDVIDGRSLGSCLGDLFC
jgi:legumain